MYLSVFNRIKAVQACKKLNATLPFSWKHINALHENNFVAKDIG